MSRARALLLAFVGLAFPVGLALAVYVTSASSLAAVPTVVSAPEQIGRSAAATEPATTAPTTTSGTTDDDRDEPRDDDLPGKCDDPDHELDPDCDPRAADDDSSGPGSGSDDSSGSGSNSGSGSDSSGKGSGGDD
jgi:uncharacterized membrane protein YgcG